MKPQPVESDGEVIFSDLSIAGVIVRFAVYHALEELCRLPPFLRGEGALGHRCLLRHRAERDGAILRRFLVLLVEIDNIVSRRLCAYVARRHRKRCTKHARSDGRALPKQSWHVPSPFRCA